MTRTIPTGTFPVELRLVPGKKAERTFQVLKKPLTTIWHTAFVPTIGSHVSFAYKETPEGETKYIALRVTDVTYCPCLPSANSLEGIEVLTAAATCAIVVFLDGSRLGEKTLDLLQNITGPLGLTPWIEHEMEPDEFE